MEWITSSKLFKSSKYKDKILSEFQNPINKPLVQQLTSYVDSKYVEPDEGADAPDIPETEKKPRFKQEPKGAHGGSGGGSHFSSPSSSNGQFDMPEDASFDEETSESESTEEVPAESPELEESNEVEESSKLNFKAIQSSSYVTVETVSQAVNEIPGILNLREDTAGVTYSVLKNSSNNEIWIYYSNDIDINKVLEKVNEVLVTSGYYFLEFNRVSRDENAIVFTVNWISNYFKPVSFKEVSDEG